MIVKPMALATAALTVLALVFSTATATAAHDAEEAQYSDMGLAGAPIAYKPGMWNTGEGPWEVFEQWPLGDVTATVLVYSDNRWRSRLLLERGGETLADWISTFWRLRDTSHDFNGDGLPDVVLEDYAGGAHCCTTVHVFDPANGFRHLFSIDIGNGGYGLADPDGDGHWEFMERDDIFAYWAAAYAFSPFPDTVLRYRNGTLEVATDLMQRPLAELLAMSRCGDAPCTVARVADVLRDEVSSVDDWNVYEDRDFLDFILSYIYAGQAGTAWEILDGAWIQDEASKVEFRERLLRQLRKSPYWSALVEMNGVGLTAN